MRDEVLRRVQGIRKWYPDDTEIGAMFKELQSDLDADAPREEIIADAEALLAKLPQGSQARMTMALAHAVLSST